MKVNYDFIGDIHGYYDELRALLLGLGYEDTGNHMAHPSRQAFFLGDLVDRGPQICEVIELVRNMIAAGAARGIMGNHELNLIGFYERSEQDPAEFLRPRNPRNWALCKHSLEQIPKPDMPEYLNWFKTLPLFVDEPEFRAIHACWNAEAVKVLTSELDNGVIRKNHFQDIYIDKNKVRALELLLKGPELELPKGLEFLDEIGQRRRRTRYCWWNPSQGVANTLPGLEIKELKYSPDLPSYGVSEKPLFFGHYCLHKAPYVTASNAQCLDFRQPNRVTLTAYRFSGEAKINEKNLFYLK